MIFESSADLAQPDPRAARLVDRFGRDHSLTLCRSRKVVSLIAGGCVLVFLFVAMPSYRDDRGWNIVLIIVSALVLLAAVLWFRHMTKPIEMVRIDRNGIAVVDRVSLGWKSTVTWDSIGNIYTDLVTRRLDWSYVRIWVDDGDPGDAGAEPRPVHIETLPLLLDHKAPVIAEALNEILRQYREAKGS